MDDSNPSTTGSDSFRTIDVGDVELEGDLRVPEGASGLVLFAHGSGSSRHSPRNNFVAERLRDRGVGTLLFDLLTEAEDRDPDARFDIDLLTERLVGATEWVRERSDVGDLAVGYFGSSTGAAAALRAAARPETDVGAVVSRGGRVDMAEAVLGDVTAATLFVVGGADHPVREWNEAAFEQLGGDRSLEVVPGAGHLFEGEGQLETVADHAADWFAEHLA
ncbi:dienelactone hydrolase-like enzyme [Halovivax ruber XH-70]|uniref:Dienelactone hydrolase-like enzyme n=1 Tax=Halovivax ruber (strain DSM 18193 / JCM 13892 / XH-70) TaxID=797302 RepID=L0IBA5_HALRX|nr:dienelactone hydrolase family protein [Halovivax ruber]AGB15526.1 dienelactone hydrolase-like enzyme [Halovivax ruber XH-70]